MVLSMFSHRKLLFYQCFLIQNVLVLENWCIEIWWMRFLIVEALEEPDPLLDCRRSKDFLQELNRDGFPTRACCLPCCSCKTSWSYVKAKSYRNGFLGGLNGINTSVGPQHPQRCCSFSSSRGYGSYVPDYVNSNVVETGQQHAHAPQVLKGRLSKPEFPVPFAIFSCADNMVLCVELENPFTGV